ncbi:uncharacterized protein MELLADRAFT_50812 [Melampsora larici-populina 98AG31]|uniref:HTH APSES-type domain-containing protein n=1 Tax=Melampsora larici-populina (strain 98AG31 / pathotype 3-4-7) TaxID=747676 RepID=F4S8Q2_MELLP|nr:uncharacterized protein MELLADRAFT_50812 [Melampsora larici-populina 98AG31]EGF98934.1 hypothetical protein MELLADRAFT_50812 [Melampsora larici-populina 98AG31]
MTTVVIFKATYLGVPVFEMPCKGVAVMRRRNDSWLNATQILKVAGFDKPQRTRVLEREVQKGTHEKIQGGYGKYQGTWVPFERGVELAKQYGVDHLLAPITDYQPSANESPPLAPKHVTAPSSRAKTSKAAAAAARANAATLGSKLPAIGGSGRKTNNSRSNFDSDSDRSFSVTPLRDPPVGTVNWQVPSQPNRSISATYSQTKMNVSTPDVPLEAEHLGEPQAAGASRNKGKARETEEQYEEINVQRGKRKYEDEPVAEEGYNDVLDDSYTDENGNDPASSKYARAILDYFVSESGEIPDFLIHPPNDFDPNVIIDDDGHTALHWACAMGRTKIVELLLACGAEIFRANHVGQTALMRAVMFTNNHDLGKFPELFEVLNQSTINIDRNDRTVFHYVVDIALQKGKVHAARYYLETILNRLSEYPKELADILNFQDEDGETALTLAARSRSKRLVKILLDHGANPKIGNREGKTAEDYILEDEKFQGVPMAQYLTNPNGLELHSSDTQSSMLTGMPPPPCPDPYIIPALIPVMDEAMPQMVQMIESLAASFDSTLNEKEHDLNHANGLLNGIQSELAEGQQKLTNYQALLADFSDKRSEQARLEAELNEKMSKRYRFGWEKYVRDEEEREKIFKEQQHSLTQQIQTSEQQSGSGTNINLRECDRVRANLMSLRDERAELFREFINLSSENVPSDERGEGSATANRLNDYRRLISIGCGGIGLDEVDEVIESLSEGIDFPVSDLLASNVPGEQVGSVSLS